VKDTVTRVEEVGGVWRRWPRGLSSAEDGVTEYVMAHWLYGGGGRGRGRPRGEETGGGGRRREERRVIALSEGERKGVFSQDCACGGLLHFAAASAER
jgi:hypothetical protein